MLKTSPKINTLSGSQAGDLSLLKYVLILFKLFCFPQYTVYGVNAEAQTFCVIFIEILLNLLTLNWSCKQRLFYKM